MSGRGVWIARPDERMSEENRGQPVVATDQKMTIQLFGVPKLDHYLLETI
jgi:hypothetical protein